eukprot:scaffold123187_cov30-Tisochrysis_lutea.AAC.2
MDAAGHMVGAVQRASAAPWSRPCAAQRGFAGCLSDRSSGMSPSACTCQPSRRTRARQRARETGKGRGARRRGGAAGQLASFCESARGPNERGGEHK